MTAWVIRLLSAQMSSGEWKIRQRLFFNVEDYMEFISIQTDSTVRNVARLYPYDVIDEEK